MTELARLKQFLIEANTTNSSNEKKEILRKYSDLNKIFRYTYDTMYQYGVTSANVEKLKDKLGHVEYSYRDLFVMLDDLRLRKITGHTAISSILDFISRYPEYANEIYCILDKNLKVRIDTKMINTIFPNTIPTFDVALANKYDAKDKKIKIDDGAWYCSRKLDGIRCITIIQNTEIKFFSRAGKEFNTLGKLAGELHKWHFGLNDEELVLDGEMCLRTENGEDDFQGIISLIKRKDYTIENPHYKIFDMLTIDEFYGQANSPVFSKRYDLLQMTIPKSNYFSVVEQIKITSMEQFEQLRNEARKKNWEGLMLRKNISYESGRTKNLLKVKDMQSEEYVVEDVVFGPFRIINPNTKLEETIETLSSVIIRHKGNIVNVGSGFSLEERKTFYKNKNDIIGKKIEVNYFEESSSNGEFSLRFPVYKGLRDYE